MGKVGGDASALPFTLRRIGDCEAPGIIAAAVYAGHRYASELEAVVDIDEPMQHDRPVVGSVLPAAPEPVAAGGDPAKVVFSGVAKSEAEMRLALDKEILCFNLESEAELERLNRVAGSMGKKARVSVRVNPDIDAGTHPYISTGLKQNKFGIPIARAPEV
jgi:hypothetical protein